MDKKLVFLLILLASFLTILFYSFMVRRTKEENPSPEITAILKPFSREVTILLAGDVMLGRSVLTWSDKAGDVNYPFKKVSGVLKDADIVFANLEAPFVSGCPRTNSGMKFCSDPKMVGGLRGANIGVVTLANNHINNYGQAGLTETKKVLKEAGIDSVGDGNLAVKVVRGVRFGFLGFNFVGGVSTVFDYGMVTKAKEKVDILIVGVHWGAEYQAKAGKTQTAIAEKLIKAGADVIAGHHPHWVQNTEHVDGKPVYYSLGNFVFDQPWSEQTKKGLVMKLTFRNGKLVKEEKLPIYTPSLGQPEFGE